jgi:DNA repair protein SbcD/Mre11
LKIGHIADLHLGFRAYHRTNERGTNLREADVSAAAWRGAEAIARIRPDLLVVPGDIFHAARPPNAAIGDAFRLFSWLAQACPGMPIVIISGNHDSPRSSDTTNIVTLLGEIPGLHVVADRSRWVRLEALDAAILCMPHNYLSAGEAPPIEPDPTVGTNLLMLHTTVTGDHISEKLRVVAEFGGETLHQTAIGPEKWDYVALGHYHITTAITPNMWYSGSPERCSSNIWLEADEKKGFLVYDTDQKRAEFVELETRPVIDLPVIHAGGMGPSEMDAAVRAAVESIAGGFEGKIIRQVVSGLPRPLLREMDHAQLRAYKAGAAHFQFDVRPARTNTGRGDSTSGVDQRRPLGEQVEGFLDRWPIRTERVARENLLALGRRYLNEGTD